MSQNVADSLNLPIVANKTDSHISRTPSPPPPPSAAAIARLSKSQSTASYQLQDFDDSTCQHKALMPSLDNHYNCRSSLYAIVAASRTRDQNTHQHQHQCCQHQHHNHHHNHSHSHSHNHHHHHNHSHLHRHRRHSQHKNESPTPKETPPPTPAPAPISIPPEESTIDQTTTESPQSHHLRHHKSSPSIGLHVSHSQKVLKSPSGSLSFIFGGSSNTSTPKTSSKSSSSSVSVSVSGYGYGSVSRSTHTKKKWRNSSYHSCDDLDAVASSHNKSNKVTSSAEKKVVSSLKYLCACTGATLRNLSKKTKDLHEKSFNGYTEPTWRVWGEEREKNAIFTVYLKKVRYHRPTPTAATTDSDGEISHLAWETVRVRFVKAATLARLVEALATDDGELESTFINVFLSTYRTFSTPKEVLNLLIRRYNTLHEKYLQELAEHGMVLIDHGDGVVHTEFIGSDSNDATDYDPSASIHEQHKRTLVSALHVWLDGFPEDWNEENLQILKSASKRLPSTDLRKKVLHRLERILRQQVCGDSNAPPWLSGVTGNGINLSIGGMPFGVSTISGIGVNCGILPQHYNNSELSDQFAEICLAPALRGATHILQTFRFPNVPVKHFAEQLTRMDSELFKRLIPHQCLGATWARRDKRGSETVVATINQFNDVLFRVISSILIEPKLKSQERAINIATWIDIAQELRLLKNFSSLKAIISGLQSNPIYRLSKTWAVLAKEKMEIFRELARIFSEDNNAWAQREVLMREGTAKFADTVGENDSHLQKIIQKQSTQTSHGTIPYLGIFLTDLTMIHAAIPDTIGDEGFINFDKKRKEFEVLAQLKLLQGAANTYNLHEDLYFDRWFASMPVLDEREAYTLSCKLEAPPPAPRKSTTSTNNSLTTTTTGSSGNHGGALNGGVYHGGGHRKTDSIASNSSSGAGSQFYCELNNSYSSHFSSRHSSLDRDAQLPHASLISASSSASNLSLDSSNSGGQKSNNSRMTHSQSANGIRSAATGNGGGGNGNSNGGNNNNSSPRINGQYVQPPGSSAVPAFYIIRVTCETDQVDGIIYKSIMLGNSEHTPQVIRNAMMKLGLEADPDNYTLAQVLPDKELVMPRSTNVYYAVNTNYNLNFILRPKKDDKDNNTTS